MVTTETCAHLLLRHGRARRRRMVVFASRVHAGSGDLDDLFWRAGRGRFTAGFTKFIPGEFKCAGGENGGTFKKWATVRRGFYQLQKVKLL